MLDDSLLGMVWGWNVNVATATKSFAIRCELPVQHLLFYEVRIDIISINKALDATLILSVFNLCSYITSPRLHLLFLNQRQLYFIFP